MTHKIAGIFCMCLLSSFRLAPVKSQQACEEGELMVGKRCRAATKVSDVKPEVSKLMKELLRQDTKANAMQSKSIAVQEVNKISKNGMIAILEKLQKDIGALNNKTASDVGDAIIWVRELYPGGDGKLFCFHDVTHGDMEETLSYRVLAVKANSDATPETNHSVSFMMTSYTQTVSRATVAGFAKNFALESLPDALTALAGLALTPGLGSVLGAGSLAAAAMPLDKILATVGLQLASVASDFVKGYAATGKIGQADRDLAEAIFFSEMLSRANTKCIHPGDDSEDEPGFYIAWKPVPSVGKGKSNRNEL